MGRDLQRIVLQQLRDVESESESFDDGQPLEPLPPPPAEYLVDWEFLKRAG